MSASIPFVLIILCQLIYAQFEGVSELERPLQKQASRTHRSAFDYAGRASWEAR